MECVKGRLHVHPTHFLIPATSKDQEDQTAASKLEDEGSYGDTETDKSGDDQVETNLFVQSKIHWARTTSKLSCGSVVAEHHFCPILGPLFWLCNSLPLE